MMSAPTVGTVHLLDVDLAAARLLTRVGYVARCFADADSLLASLPRAQVDCIILDASANESDGFAPAERLRGIDPATSVVFTSACGSVADAVDAIRRHGPVDYLDKPLDEGRLLAAVAEGVQRSGERRRTMDRVALLSAREREVFELLVLGHTSKVIAARLGISPKTVDDHRSAVLSKTGTTTLSGLIALAPGSSHAVRPIRG